MEQHNVCRCCLIASGTWDLNKQYEGSGRVIEVFSDLLKECFGFTLAHLQENSYSHNICDQCVGRLRDASSFRKQVLTAELAFAEYIDKTTHVERIFTASAISGGASLIKVEPDLIQNNNYKIVYESDNESDHDAQGITIKYFKKEKNYKKHEVTITDSAKTDNAIKKRFSKSSKKVKKTKKFSKSTSKEVKLEPVDIYLPEHESIERESCKLFKNKSVKNNKKADISKSAESLEKNKQSFQNRILYRCLRENTAVVLKNSTVIPFRYLRFTNGKYTCQYCELNYLQINDLRSHVEEQHVDITETEILSFLKWPVFQLTKAEISLIKCKLCADTFENLESLTDHLVNAHGKSYHSLDFKPAHGILGFLVDSKNPKCFLCSKEFPFFQALVVHMSEHGSENFKCEKCGKKFFTWTRLSVHKSRAHEELPQTFKCKFCDEIFPKISTRQSHMKTKHRYGWLKCGECGDSFLDHKQRSRHMVKAHNYKTPSFSCSQCPKVFTSASNLGAHVKTHGDNKIYNCEVCGKKLTSKHSLTIHLRVHTGERPYACQFCEKRFKSYTILDMHERGHLNDKRYICELCDTAYVQIHSLRRHYRSHHPDSGIDLTKLRAKKVD